MRNLFSNPSKVLNWCLVFATAFIFLYDFWLIQIPEKIVGGYKFGSIFYKICLAFITSYIFYFVNVHLKKKVDKENLSPYLAKKTHFIVQMTKNLFSDLGNHSSKNFQVAYPPKEEIVEACKSMSIMADAPRVQLVPGAKPVWVKLNWLEYFEYHRIEISKVVQEIFAVMPHLESEYIKILNAIYESGFFQITHNISQVASNLPLKITNLELWGNELYDYSLLIKSLEEYYEKKLIDFSPGYTRNIS